jgi:cyclopropane-fatty-acyl-phospholipid synthase
VTAVAGRGRGTAGKPSAAKTPGANGTPGAAKTPGAAGTVAWAASRAGVVLPVRVRAWDGSESGPTAAPAVILRSPRALRRILWRPGELGLARAYVSGDLDVEGDLTEGLRRARQVFGPGRAGWGRAGWGPAQWAEAVSAAMLAARRLGVFGAPPPPPDCEIRHSGRPHSRARDRAVIAGHYDLPASFFRLILDPSMAYSCGYWASDAPGYGLADAQRDKLDLVADKLGLGPGSSLLDLGCGSTARPR